VSDHDEATDAPSVEDLRERAKELDVPGRSRMNGEQLAAAIGIAERKKAEADAAIARSTSDGPREQSFPVSRLRSDPAILGGVSRATLAAALTDADVGDDDELTRPEVDELIERSQQRPVNEEA